MVARGIGGADFKVGPDMWWWRKVRRADIPDELRTKFESYGEDVLAHAVAIGAHSMSQGLELVTLIQGNRPQIMEWLRERRDVAARHEDRIETLEWAILIAVVVGVAADIAIVAHESGWLHSN